jgi:hypothetical protein
MARDRRLVGGKDGREIELAIAGQLPTLVSDDDIRGLLHCHTDFSDGGNTLEEMAEVTRVLATNISGWLTTPPPMRAG